MEIKGLLEVLGLSQSDVDRLRQLRIEAAAERLRFLSVVISKGGNIHGVNRSATEKRRARNKVARAQRKVNRRTQ